jgi:transposase
MFRPLEKNSNIYFNFFFLHTEQQVKKMKLSAIFYLKQLGFSQYDISTMVGMKRTTVQAITDRVASTGTTLSGKSTSGSSTFDEYARRYLERVIRRYVFQMIDALRGELCLMDKNVCRSTVKKWIKQLGFKYHSPASGPKLTREQKKKRLD